MSNIRCPVCGGQHVTPPTPLMAETRQSLQLNFVTNPQGGMFSKGVVTAFPSVGCACLNCGYWMCFLDPDSLARLRAAPALHPGS